MKPRLLITVDKSLGFTSYQYTVKIPLGRDFLTLKSDLTYDSFQECIDALTATWLKFAPATDS